MKKILPLSLITATLLLGCQENHPTAQDNAANPLQNVQHLSQTHLAETTTQIVQNTAELNIDDILKINSIQFRKVAGEYPLLIDEKYQAINHDIQKTIDELSALDAQFSGEMVEGVDRLEYSVINFDHEKLSLSINYHVQDMTARYFNKYYQIDLKNHKQVSLPDHLLAQKTDIEKLNTAFNEYLKPCIGENMPEYCSNIPLIHLVGNYDFNDNKIDIINHHDSFYIQDKNTIVATFNSSKYTAEFTINLNTYQITAN